MLQIRIFDFLAKNWKLKGNENMTNNWLQSIIESMRTSHLLRGLLIGFLILLLLIPIKMIGNVIWEREEARNKAVREVTSSWGGNQSFVGPWITVPYLHHWTEKQTSWSDPVLCTNCHERFGSGFSLPLFGVGRGVAPTGTEQWAAYTLGLFPPNDECGRFSL